MIASDKGACYNAGETNKMPVSMNRIRKVLWVGEKKKTLLRTTMAVTLLIFVSKAGGFLREVVMTAYYGAGAEMDAYNMAYSLYYVPVLLFNSCITSTVVPVYLKIRHDAPERLERFSNNIISIFAMFAILVSIVMYFLAAPLTAVMARGFSAEGQALTVHMLRVMLPSLCFIVTSIVLSSILNAREHYLAAQLTGFPLTAALLAATVGFSGTLGVRALAWGVFVSGILQVIVLLPAMRKIHGYRPMVDLSDGDFRRLMLLAGPAVLNMAVNELNHMIDKMLASGLPAGHLTCMNLAYRLITFLVGVVLVPLETVMFSKMSLKTAAHDEKALSGMIMRSMELVALIIFPIMAVGAMLPDDVIRLAYKHGVVTEESVTTAGIALRFYILGVFSYGMRDILTRAFNACEDTRTPMFNAMGTVVINIVLNIALVKVMGVGGLALATSISATAGVVSLLVLLRRRLGRMHARRTLEELIKIGIATVAAMIVCLFISHLMPSCTTSLQSLGKLVVCTGASLIAYAAVALLLRVRWMVQGAGMLASRLGRGAR